MDRREANKDYVAETIEMDAAFIQLRGEIYPAFADYAKLLKDNGVRINYFGTDDADEIKLLFDYGVDFPLVDDILSTIHIVTGLGIQPVKAQFSNVQ